MEAGSVITCPWKFFYHLPQELKFSLETWKHFIVRHISDILKACVHWRTVHECSTFVRPAYNEDVYLQHY